jgi:excinuclease ABC subunit C
VLEAIILEADYIKKYQPKYNVLGKDDKSWNYLLITKDKYPCVKIVRQHEWEGMRNDVSAESKNTGEVFGPYPNLNGQAMLKILRRIFFISECHPEQKKPCLYYQMDQCLGVCTGEINADDYRKKVIQPLKSFLRGHKKQVIKNLEKEMKLIAKKENFEEASRLRNQIFALRKIQDITLLRKDFLLHDSPMVNFSVKRIEGYDISNIGDSDKVGSMVVFDAFGPIKKEYRKFKIKTVIGQSDVACLQEVLERRFAHIDWPMPEVVLIDGGLPQINLAKKILLKMKNDAFLLGIAKGAKRNKNEFILVSKNPIFLDWVRANKNLLIQVRDEAHRFAITFHRQRRERIIS